MKHLLAALLTLAALPVAAAPRVASDIAPVHSLAAMVMGDVGTPALILPADTSPHSYAMAPSAARALQEADIVFWVGEALSPGFADAVEVLAAEALQVELAEVPGLELLDAEGAGHAHGDGHAHHDDLDPHLWLDPANARRIVAAMAEALSATDPANAETYRENAERADAALAGLEARIAARLAPVRATAYVTFHDAYGYFEHRFGLTGGGAISAGDAVRPGATRLRKVRANLAARGVVCVFSEPQLPDRLIATVTEGTSVRTGVLDPMGAGLAPGPELYPALLTRLADTLADCLAG